MWPVEKASYKPFLGVGIPLRFSKQGKTKGTDRRRIGGMRKTVSALFFLSMGLCMAQQPSTPFPKRIYIEERIKTSTGSSVHCDNYGNCFGHAGNSSRNVSLEVTKEVVKQCAAVLTVTDNRDAADYDLRISPGSSTLYRSNGDVAYVSPTKYRVSNLAKDVCNFVRNTPQ
jgi:hypothetical protein